MLVGAEADIKFPAYDAIAYGAIRQNMQSISVNSVGRPDGSHFLKADIAMMPDFLWLKG